MSGFTTSLNVIDLLIKQEIIKLIFEIDNWSKVKCVPQNVVLKDVVLKDVNSYYIMSLAFVIS